MANKEIQARVKHKRDTSSNWTQNNPVLLNGEIVLVDTAEGELRAKIGDGTKTYTQLPFSDEVLRSLINNNKVTVDDELSTDSTNPVQNKIVTTEINDIKMLVGDTSVAEQINTVLTSNQSDWDVNDESSASFIKNRTHWVVPITNVVFENSSAAFSALDGMYICNESLGFTVSEKSTYLVNWDGVDYNCVPHVYSSMTTIGNVSIINGPDETDEPFVIFMSDSDTLCVTSSTATTHSIVVTETSEQVYKIDEKFLPDDIAFKSDIPDMPTVPTKVSELTNDVDYVTLVKGESKNFEFVRDETYSGDHFIYNGFDYYKVSDMAPIYDDVSAVSGTWYANGNLSTQNNLVEGASCYYAGHSIVVTEAGACTLSGKTFNAPSIGIYFKKSSDTYYQTALSITCAYKRLSDSVIPDTIARVTDIPDVVTIDSTLTIEGQAADAKVTGDAISNLNTLVGDTSVSEQITNAISDKADIEHTHNYAGADEPGGAANKVTSAYDLSDLGTYPILLAKPFPNDDGTVHKAGNETYATCGLYHSAGTTTNEGTAMLVLGNSIASGSNNNETGEIMLYNAKGKSFTILPLNGIDVGHTYFLPSEAGTLITEQQTYTRTEVEELIAAAKASVMPKIGTIALTTNWTGTASPYYQDVTYSYITETSMVDLLPTPEQLAQWQEDGLAFTTQSGNGTVRVYVSGGKPTSTIAVQVKIQEVTQL